MSTLSNYELLEQIAESPQAVVFKAYRRNNPQRLLVLKTLPASRLSEYRKAQIRQKIEHLKVLNDPLVITPISFGDQDGICFITQDYFDGVTLDRLLANMAGFLCPSSSPLPVAWHGPWTRSTRRGSSTAASSRTTSSSTRARSTSG